MNWTDVRHQERAQRWLDLALRGGRLPHAFIFAGPDGVGKKMTALRLARRLLCPRGGAMPDVFASSEEALFGDASAPPPPADDACGACEDCAAVDAGTHIDLHVIHRFLNRFHPDPLVRRRQATELGVDVIRHFLIDPIARRPARGRAKIFIIDEAERMNVQAQNALLKTLEEPPGAAYLFLIASNADRLGQTVRSRCQIVPFARLPDQFVRERLAAAQPELSDADCDYLVGLADGRLGVALQFAERGLHECRTEATELLRTAIDDPVAFSKSAQQWVTRLAKEMAAAEAEATGRAAVAETEDDGDEDDSDEDDNDGKSDDSSSRQDAAALRMARGLLISMLACTLRDVLRQRLGAAPAAYAGDPARVRDLAGRLTQRGCAQAIRALASAENDLERSANVGLVFDAVGIAIERAAG